MSVSASQPIVELLSTARDLSAVSPSASTAKPVHVIVAAVRSPAISTAPSAVTAPLRCDVPSTSRLFPRVVAPVALSVPLKTELPLTVALVATRAAKVPAAALLAPTTVPSIAPLSTLMLVMAW